MRSNECPSHRKAVLYLFNPFLAQHLAMQLEAEVLAEPDSELIGRMQQLQRRKVDETGIQNTIASQIAYSTTFSKGGCGGNKYNPQVSQKILKAIYDEIGEAPLVMKTLVDWNNHLREPEFVAYRSQKKKWLVPQGYHIWTGIISHTCLSKWILFHSN